MEWSGGTLQLRSASSYYVNIDILHILFSFMLASVMPCLQLLQSKVALAAVTL